MKKFSRSVALVLFLCLLSVASASQLTSSAGSPSASASQNNKKNPSDNELYDLDKMSSMGRLAYLVSTGRMDKAIAKAQARRKRGKASVADLGNANAIQADDVEADEGDDDDELSGPPGGQSETSIAVDSTGQHIVVGYNDFRGFGLNPLSVSGFMYSDDGGSTFVDGGQLPVTVPTSMIGTAVFPRIQGDPDVKYLGGSTFIYFSIMTKTISATGVAMTMGMHRSTDFGHTWTGPYEIPAATNPNGLFSGVNARDFADKEFADVDPDTGRVMMSWSNFTTTTIAPGGVEISAVFSDDAATATPPTWSARRVVAGDGQGSIPRFAGNGSPRAYLAWSRSTGFLLNNVGFAVSSDNGETWPAPLNTTTNFFTMDQVLGNDRVHNLPSLAVDRSSKATAGNIYLVYANNNNRDGADIAFQRSVDGGITFSAPVFLNSRPGADRAQWFPWTTVDPNTGRVYVFYYDQGSATSGDLTEISYQFSDDGGLTWSTPANLDNRSFRAGFGNDLGQPNLGDYNQAVAQNGELFVTWAGTHPVTFTDGWPAQSFTVPDVFFKRVTNSKAPLRIGTVSFTDSGANGFIDPGEQARFTFPLQHYVTNPVTAPVALTGITATLTTTTPGVSIVQDTSTYADTNPGDTASNDVAFVIQVAPTFVPFTTIQLQLNVTTNQGNTVLAYSQTTGTPTLTTLFSEDFDTTPPGSLPTGWTTSHVLGNNTVAWTTSTFGGSNGAFHVNANDGLSGDNSRFERLSSPVIQVPANTGYVTLEFDVKYDTEDNPLFNIYAFDGFLLRVLDATVPPFRSVLAEAFADVITTGGGQHYPKHFPRSGGAGYFADMSAWAGDSNGVQHVL
jgi:hypothetical protein